jgi:uncharacterized protein (TIGR03067 family)
MKNGLRLAFLATLVCVGLGIAQDAARQELEKQQGIWVAVSFRHDGQDTPVEIVRTISRTVENDHVVWKRNGKSFAGTALVLNPGPSPKEIDVIPDGGRWAGQHVLGIYRIRNEELTICMADPGQPRPREFKAEKGAHQTLMTFRRERGK